MRDDDLLAARSIAPARVGNLKKHGVDFLEAATVPSDRKVFVMHHKRGRSRNRRAGCKLCKPWKVNGFRTERREGEKFSDHRRRRVAALDLQEFTGQV